MNRICVFTAEGVEEVEALTVVDLLRRQKCDVDMISLGDSLQVTGSHGIVFMADKKMSETDFSSYDTLVIPGGLKGTSNLKQEPNVLAEIGELPRQRPPRSRYLRGPHGPCFGRNSGR